jgi:hypothetical protein
MKLNLFVSVAGCAAISVIAACSAAPTTAPGGPTPEEPATTTTALSPAEQFVRLNADLDMTAHLVGRARYNEDTEVLSFYEPSPGTVIVVGGGTPKDHATVQPSEDAVSLWNVVSPGAAMPQTLVDALARQASGMGDKNLVSNAPDAPESLSSASSDEAKGAAPVAENGAPTGVQTVDSVERTGSTSAALVGGYCDTQWTTDYPTNMASQKISVCAASGGSHFTSNNGAWVAPFNWSIEPYGNTCTCSCRTVQGFQRLHVGSSWVDSGGNKFENYANGCSVVGTTQMSLTGTFNFSVNIPENGGYWMERTGTVTCVATTCAKTNDVGSYHVVWTPAPGGLLNFISEFYGP